MTTPGAFRREHVKRATRFKVEVVDADGDVAWEVLAHDWPTAKLAAALTSYGYTWRRASDPSDGPVGPNYSSLDPDNSIAAAIEFADRRDGARGRVLRLLVMNVGVWIPRYKIRQVGGDSGDRRVRELRQLNWPIEMKQLDGDDAWSVRLVIPGREVPPPSVDEPFDQISMF